MKYFAAFLPMRDPEMNVRFRPQHLEFLEKQEKAGRIFARGKFMDGAGGLVIYKAESLADAVRIAESDPYVANGVRGLEIHEWDVVVGGVRQAK